MMKMVIDGRLIHSREHLFDEMKKALDLPDYFGDNLDALYDVLTEQDGDPEVVFINERELQASLGGSYIRRLTRMLEDAGVTITRP